MSRGKKDSLHPHGLMFIKNIGNSNTFRMTIANATVNICMVFVGWYLTTIWDDDHRPDVSSGVNTSIVCCYVFAWILLSVFTWFCIPASKYKSLEQINRVF
ncbi:hypothetical protein LY76DRAFT_667140 [Colletotrichum caudatum]|nr:hypothetical protein LY76DRAFT_667140 [Colletotrichum caudatum]